MWPVALFILFTMFIFCSFQQFTTHLGPQKTIFTEAEEIESKPLSLCRYDCSEKGQFCDSKITW